jgi:hypothetical protein
LLLIFLLSIASALLQASPHFLAFLPLLSSLMLFATLLLAVLLRCWRRSVAGVPTVSAVVCIHTVADIPAIKGVSDVTEVTDVAKYLWKH